MARHPAARPPGHTETAGHQVNDCPELIADEPTGQLDSETGRSIMEALRALVDSRGMTTLVATHDANLIELADRVLTLRDGRLSEH